MFLGKPSMAKRSRGGPYIINIFCRQIEKKIRLSKQEEELKSLIFDAAKKQQQFLTSINWNMNWFEVEKDQISLFKNELSIQSGKC